MLKRIDPPSRLLNFGREQLAGLLALSQTQHVWQKLRQRRDRVVQIRGSEGKTIGIDVIRI